MITHLIQEMQDVTLVAASVHAWIEISRSVVHTANVERALGSINSVLFARVTRVVVAVFKCVRIGGILTIKGSCTVSTRQAWNSQVIHTWQIMHFIVVVSRQHFFLRHFR